jgi:hypothetical protein
MPITTTPPTAGATLSSAGVRLRLQSLAQPEKLLTVAALAQARNESGTFLTGDIVSLFTDLRLPPTANVSAGLDRLRKGGLVMNPSARVWALTPKGEASVNAEVTTEELTASLDATEGTIFGERRHALIPPFLGPADSAVKKIFDLSPFEKNVMLITRFPKGKDDHLTTLIESIRLAVGKHGLNLLVASDGNKKDVLWENVNTYMWASKYAIVLMDNMDGKFNSNVLIEVGGMLMTGRRCAILRDESVEQMPSDMIGHIYRATTLTDHVMTVQQVHEWIRDDLGISSCSECP